MFSREMNTAQLGWSCIYRSLRTQEFWSLILRSGCLFFLKPGESTQGGSCGSMTSPKSLLVSTCAKSSASPETHLEVPAYLSLDAAFVWFPRSSCQTNFGFRARSNLLGKAGFPVSFWSNSSIWVSRMFFSPLCSRSIEVESKFFMVFGFNFWVWNQKLFNIFNKQEKKFLNGICQLWWVYNHS